MSSPVAFPWPVTLSTPRLLLRPVEPADEPQFERLWTDPEVRRFLGGPVTERRLPSYRAHFAGRSNAFSVTTRDEATVIGSVSVDPKSPYAGRNEVSFTFLPEHWGRGYAREAVAAVVDWALAAAPTAHTSMVAVTQEANTRSRRLLESIGMRHVESFVEWDAPQVMYAIGEQRAPVSR